MEEPQALVEEVRKLLDAPYPKLWNFEEDGPEIIGYAVSKEVGQTVHGACDILILQEASSKELRSVWLFHTALQNQMYRKRPQVGDLVGIRQLGEREPQSGGRPYMDYSVVVMGEKGNALEWDSPAELVQDTQPTREEQQATSWGPPVTGGAGVEDAEVVSSEPQHVSTALRGGGWE